VWLVLRAQLDVSASIPIGGQEHGVDLRAEVAYRVSWMPLSAAWAFVTDRVRRDPHGWEGILYSSIQEDAGSAAADLRVLDTSLLDGAVPALLQETSIPSAEPLAWSPHASPTVPADSETQCWVAADATVIWQDVGGRLDPLQDLSSAYAAPQRAFSLPPLWNVASFACNDTDATQRGKAFVHLITALRKDSLLGNEWLRRLYPDRKQRTARSRASSSSSAAAAALPTHRLYGNLYLPQQQRWSKPGWLMVVSDSCDSGAESAERCPPLLSQWINATALDFAAADPLTPACRAQGDAAYVYTRWSNSGMLHLSSDEVLALGVHATSSALACCSGDASSMPCTQWLSLDSTGMNRDASAAQFNASMLLSPLSPTAPIDILSAFGARMQGRASITPLPYPGVAELLVVNTRGDLYSSSGAGGVSLDRAWGPECMPLVLALFSDINQQHPLMADLLPADSATLDAAFAAYSARTQQPSLTHFIRDVIEGASLARPADGLQLIPHGDPAAPLSLLAHAGYHNFSLTAAVKRTTSWSSVDPQSIPALQQLSHRISAFGSQALADLEPSVPCAKFAYSSPAPQTLQSAVVSEHLTVALMISIPLTGDLSGVKARVAPLRPLVSSLQARARPTFDHSLQPIFIDGFASLRIDSSDAANASPVYYLSLVTPTLTVCQLPPRATLFPDASYAWDTQRLSAPVPRLQSSLTQHAVLATALDRPLSPLSVNPSRITGDPSSGAWFSALSSSTLMQCMQSMSGQMLLVASEMLRQCLEEVISSASGESSLSLMVTMKVSGGAPQEFDTTLFIDTCQSLSVASDSSAVHSAAVLELRRIVVSLCLSIRYRFVVSGDGSAPSVSSPTA